MSEIITLPPAETALQVFSAPAGLDPYLAQIKAEIDSFVPDVSTKKGRDAIASIAHKVARSKTALDNIGKELVAELKDVPKKIDAERKRMRDTLDTWKDDVRRPLTEWEEAEESRQARHKTGIELIQQAAATHDFSASTLRATLAAIEAKSIDASWEEFESEAHRAKTKTIEALQSAIAERDRQEAEQAELTRLRAEAAAREQKEREERIAREAAERAQREAEAKAHAEREANIKREAEAKASAERRELELKLAAERAEREKAEAIQREQQAKADAAPQAQAVERDALTPAARDVLAERARQVSAEGWTPERDDQYTDCQLAAAAASYAVCGKDPKALKLMGVTAWPWRDYWWKPETYRRNLEKAGALILAEIERIDRHDGRTG